MKKIVYIGALLAFAGLAACKKEKKEDPQPQQPGFPAFDSNAPYGPKSAFLTGSVSKSWKFRKLTVGGQPVMDPCLPFLQMTFYKSAHIYTINITQPVAGCTGTDGNWNLNDTETLLRLYPLNATPNELQLIELSDTLLHYIGPGTMNGQPTTAEAWMNPL